MGNRRKTTQFLIIAALASVFLAGNVARELRFARLSRRYDELQSRIVDEVRSTSAVVESLQNALAGSAPSEFRRGPADDDPGATVAQRESHRSPQEPLAFFRAVDVLIGAENRRIQALQRQKLLENPFFQQTLATEQLEAETGDNGRIVLTRNGSRYFSVSIGQQEIEISAVHGQSLREAEFGQVSAAFLSAEADAIERHLALLEPKIDYLRSVADRGDVSALVTERNISVAGERSNQSGTSVRFSSANLTQSVLLTLDLESGQFSVNRRTAEDVETAHEILLDKLQQIIAISDEEVLIHRSRLQMEQMIADNGFQSLLAARGLRVSENARDTAHFVYFDIYRGANDHIGAFGIQRTTGEIWIIDEGDVPIMSLRRLTSSAATSAAEVRIPASVTSDFEPSERSGLTVLLLGANEGVADSIMLTHVEPERQKIHFFSIPRDLFYRGTRINRIQSNFGIERMATEIGRITGLPVDHYVMVDMYAFIDVINILGGITIEFEEELVDPTYRVREDGIWGTLYYPPGEHHLDGIGALRIARSRFSTTDFGRARRQQDIVDAIRREIAQLGLRNVGTLYTLLSRSMSYVETDLSAVDVLRYVQQYGRFRNTAHHVLSTDNVLFSTYSALHYSGKTIEEVDDGFDLGAWILLPHDDNWDLIPWYIERAIEEGSVDLEAYRVAAHSTDTGL